MSQLAEEYSARFETSLQRIASELEGQLRELLAREPRIDRVSARAKSVDRFLAKATIELDGRPKYQDPLQQIQDQIGARIITFYLSDIDRIDQIIKKYYRPIESRNRIPDSEWEFGYFGRHHILLVPSDVVDSSLDRNLVPIVFELQIKTLFQHAWSEANHDFGYKPNAGPLRAEENRRLAFTSAQAWGADHIFDELFRASGK